MVRLHSHTSEQIGEMYTADTNALVTVPSQLLAPDAGKNVLLLSKWPTQLTLLELD